VVAETGPVDRREADAEVDGALVAVASEDARGVVTLEDREPRQLAGRWRGRRRARGERRRRRAGQLGERLGRHARGDDVRVDRRRPGDRRRLSAGGRGRRRRTPVEARREAPGEEVPLVDRVPVVEEVALAEERDVAVHARLLARTERVVTVDALLVGR